MATDPREHDYAAEHVVNVSCGEAGVPAAPGAGSPSASQVSSGKSLSSTAARGQQFARAATPCRLLSLHHCDFVPVLNDEPALAEAAGVCTTPCGLGGRLADSARLGIPPSTRQRRRLSCRAHHRGALVRL